MEILILVFVFVFVASLMAAIVLGFDVINKKPRLVIIRKGRCGRLRIWGLHWGRNFDVYDSFSFTRSCLYPTGDGCFGLDVNPLLTFNSIFFGGGGDYFGLGWRPVYGTNNICLFALDVTGRWYRSEEIGTVRVGFKYRFAMEKTGKMVTYTIFKDEVLLLCSTTSLNEDINLGYLTGDRMAEDAVCEIKYWRN